MKKEARKDLMKTPTWKICEEKCKFNSKSKLEKHLETLKKRDEKSKAHKASFLDNTFAEDSNENAEILGEEVMYVIVFLLW